MEVTKLKTGKHWQKQASAPQTTGQEIELHDIITREQEKQRKETKMKDYTANSNKWQHADACNNAMQYILNIKTGKHRKRNTTLSTTNKNRNNKNEFKKQKNNKYWKTVKETQHKVSTKHCSTAICSLT